MVHHAHMQAHLIAKTINVDYYFNNIVIKIIIIFPLLVDFFFVHHSRKSCLFMRRSEDGMLSIHDAMCCILSKFINYLNE